MTGQSDFAVPFIDLYNSPDNSIYQDLDTYLTLAGARNVVREHLPFRMMGWAARLATLQNRDNPTTSQRYHYGGKPFRFVYHMITIAPSGAGKDLVDEAQQEILGPDVCFEADSGTLEGLRGTAEKTVYNTGRKIPPSPGAIERANHGWLFVPEAKSISDAAVRDAHSMSFLMKFMESGVANWNLAADHGQLNSDAGLCLSLQPQILKNSMQTIGQGLPRRALIDWYDYQDRATLHKEEMGAPADPTKHYDIRDSIRAKLNYFGNHAGNQFRPTRYDWSQIADGLNEMYEDDILHIPNDYQIVRTIAVAHTILSEPVNLRRDSRWYGPTFGADAVFTPVMNVNAWTLSRELIWNRNRLIKAAQESEARWKK